MEINILECLKIILKMGLVLILAIKMVKNFIMKDSGKKIKNMEKAGISIQMEIFMMENLEMIKNMEMADTNFLMAKNMKDNLKMIFLMEEEK